MQLNLGSTEDVRIHWITESELYAWRKEMEMSPHLPDAIYLYLAENS